MFDQNIPAPLKAFAEREFAGEKLVWAARPDVKIAFLMSFAIWLFAIPWTAFALFWESMVAGPLVLELLGYEVQGKEPGSQMRWGMFAMALFGIPFVLIGFGMLLAPVFVLTKGRSTLFVLTGRRLAILQGRSTVKVTSFLPNEIKGFSRKEGPDGRGTVILSRGYERDSDGDSVARSTELGVIDDVRKVEQTLRDWKERASPRPAEG
jgi:hypothetical protein